MKMVGVGLNKTGTKTLRSFCESWGFIHRTFDLEAFEHYRAGDVSGALRALDGVDSCEDWPWSLLYREIDKRFPEARFVLTVRRSPEAWYQSLCKMAVRLGPLEDFERHIYGHAMPQGHEAELISFYEGHNAAVQAHFADRPGKLATICWETGDDGRTLANFLGLPVPDPVVRHVNRSHRVYGGSNLTLARLNHVAYRAMRLARTVGKRIGSRQRT